MPELCFPSLKKTDAKTKHTLWRQTFFKEEGRLLIWREVKRNDLEVSG